jgi:tRNA(Ile2) C34 agmatinyltransferase TiaS
VGGTSLLWLAIVSLVVIAVGLGMFFSSRKPKTYVCPRCDGRLPKRAYRCPHCGYTRPAIYGAGP